MKVLNEYKYPRVFPEAYWGARPSLSYVRRYGELNRATTGLSKVTFIINGRKIEA